MNISSSQMKNRQRVRFSSGFMYVCNNWVKIHIAQKERTIVLLDESHSLVRSCCYRKIWKHINSNGALRLRLTGSANPVSLSQVIDMAGYGVVTVTEPIQVGKNVVLSYHPKIYGNSYDNGWFLGSCELGNVTSVED